MRRIAAVMLSLALAAASLGALAGCQQNTPAPEQASTRDITEYVKAANLNPKVLKDSYVIEGTVDKVAPGIGAMAQVTALVAGEDPVIVAAPTAQISDKFKEVLPAYVKSNPNNCDSTSVESLISSHAQVVYGPATMFSDEQLKQLEDAGIMFVPMTNLGTVDGICACTELVGAILGDKYLDNAKQFTSYWKDNIADAQKRTASLSESEKPTVLNLSFNNGALSCEAGECMVNTYVEAAGGIACTKDYAVASSTGGPSGGAALSEEQICTWNPDYIICYSEECTQQVKNNPALSAVTAVKNGNVYTAPKGLYLWPVRSGEGALMTPWLGTVINHQLFADVDMNAMVQDFFKTFYRHQITSAEADAVLNAKF